MHDIVQQGQHGVCTRGREERARAHQVKENGLGYTEDGEPSKHPNQRKDMAYLCLKKSLSSHVSNGLDMDKIRGCCQGPDER